jgi:hypothetical protein
MRNTKIDIYDGHPPQGLSEARRVKLDYAFFSHLSAAGRPFGGGGVYHLFEKEINHSCQI